MERGDFMANRKMNFDKTEIVIGFDGGKRFEIINLPYSDIQRIQFDKVVERKLFKKVPSEKISIFTGKRAGPIVYTMLDNKQFWDEYKTGLAKFATNNHLTFEDNTE